MGIVADSYSSDEFSQYLVRNNVKHIKIPLYAAWIGSFWERMMRTIKNCIRKSIGRSKLEYFQFISALSDIQNSINSRPLTYTSNELDITPLTPNHFLKQEIGKNFMLDNIVGSDISIPNRRDIVRSLEKREEILEKFKNDWYDQYLLSLRETSRDVYQSSWEDKLKIDDVVLISAPNKPRHQWTMGRITSLLPGRDDITRCVRVMRHDRTEGVYPICHLYPLEISVTPAVKTDEKDVPEQPGLRRSKRLASRRASQNQSSN